MMHFFLLEPYNLALRPYLMGRKCRICRFTRLSSAPIVDYFVATLLATTIVWDGTPICKKRILYYRLAAKPSFHQVRYCEERSDEAINQGALGVVTSGGTE